jgi:magnesium-dependent phosphatase-1
VKILAVFDADDTLWDVAEPIWDRAVQEVLGDTLVLSDGSELHLRPEVKPGLNSLKVAGAMIALASHNLDSTEYGVRAALGALGLVELFDCVVVRDSSDKNAMISDICQRLGVDMAADRVFFTDDSDKHVLNARKLGVAAFVAGPSIQPFIDAVLEAARR